MSSLLQQSITRTFLWASSFARLRVVRQCDWDEMYTLSREGYLQTSPREAIGVPFHFLK